MTSLLAGKIRPLTWIIMLGFLMSLAWGAEKGEKKTRRTKKSSEEKATPSPVADTEKESKVSDEKPASSQPAPGNAHAYFDSLAKRTDVLAIHSLRDPEQLKGKKGPNPCITYSPDTDKDPRKQDAAKIVIPSNKVSLPNQLRFPIPEAKGKSILVTWDAWFGSEFSVDKTNIPTYKNFQFASGRIWTEVRALFGSIPKHKRQGLAMVDVRYYPQGDTVGPEFNGIKYSSQTLGPMVGEFVIQPETWTRYWAFFNPKDDQFEFSLWLADEKQNPVQLLDKTLIVPNRSKGLDRWDEFWFEYNTSAHLDPKLVERVGYIRNLVMLAGVDDVPTLLKRPER